MFIDFCAIMYKARKYFQNYPIIYLNSIFHFMWCEALLVQMKQFFWKWWCIRKLSHVEDIYLSWFVKETWWLFVFSYVCTEHEWWRGTAVVATAPLQPVRLSICLYINFKWVTLDHFSHKQRWEYFKVQIDQYKACFFCKSEAVYWVVLGQALASLCLITVFEVTAAFANWYSGGCLQFSINTNELISKFY